MLTLSSNLRCEPEPIKRSRFIVDLVAVASETEAKEALAEIQREFPDATHHCTAWRIARPKIDRCDDDGEPGGSAGRPILAQLVGREVTNIAAIVTRYFGGTKLGVGGLVRAYGSSTAYALDEAKLIPYVFRDHVEFVCDYPHIEAARREITAIGGAITSEDFAALVTVSAQIPETKLDELAQTLADISAGTITFKSPEKYKN